jgi:hypothetical protein
MIIGYILWSFGIYFVPVVFLWSFGIFTTVLVCCTKKNLATLVQTNIHMYFTFDIQESIYVNMVKLKQTMAFLPPTPTKNYV